MTDRAEGSLISVTGGRQGKIKCRALVLPAFVPYFTAMILNDLFACRQSSSCSRVGIMTVQPFKYFKNLLTMLRCNSDAVITQAEQSVVATRLDCYVDLGRFIPAELDGIAY